MPASSPEAAKMSAWGNAKLMDVPLIVIILMHSTKDADLFQHKMPENNRKQGWTKR